MKDLRFPDDFHWGASTAAYQVEGGIENNDWAQAARDGRVPQCGRACDHYNRYEQDFDLAVSLGHNAHRFSIEWARIEPEEGKWNMREVEHYRAVLRALRARNLEPYVTLWHFTLPQWFADKGGFENPEAPKLFARYAAFITEKLGSEFTQCCTMNEPIVFAGLGYLKGNWPPFVQFGLVKSFELTNSGDRDKAQPERSYQALLRYRTVVKNLAAAHNQAYDAIKQTQPHITVSLVKHVVAYDANWNPLHIMRAWAEDVFMNHSFLRRVHTKCDSFGLNFYHYVKFGNRPEYKKTDMGWEMVPEGIYHALKTLYKYKKPIYISEAGLADEDDSDRAEYITKQVEATWQAMQEGVDVRAHLYWSLLDNYEWALGFEKRFGLIEINYQTLERRPRPSAHVYKEIIEQNGILE